jgi:hypothetical protein
MNVAVLQHYIRGLKDPLSAAGAAEKITTDLERMAVALEPFQALNVQQFTEFLIRCEEFARTGQISTAGSARGKKPKMLDQSKMLSAVQELKALHERSVDHDLEFTAIDAEVKKLVNKLTAEEAIAAAEEVSAGKVKTKKAALEHIARMIRDRKRSFVQVEAITSN